MSLIGVIERFATGTYTVTRRGTGTYSSGRLVAGSTSTFTITASLQPVRGRELQNLAPAQHGEEVKVLYTATLLRVRSPDGAGDLVTINSESWEVFQVEPWEAFGETHYRAYVARKPVP